jgi:hypothetical protein
MVYHKVSKQYFSQWQCLCTIPWHPLKCIPVATWYIKPVSPNIFCLELCKCSLSLFLKWADVIKISFPLLSAWVSEKYCHIDRCGDARCRRCRWLYHYWSEIPEQTIQIRQDHCHGDEAFNLCATSHISLSAHLAINVVGTCAQECWHTVCHCGANSWCTVPCMSKEKNLAHTLHRNKLIV